MRSVRRTLALCPARRAIRRGFGHAAGRPPQPVALSDSRRREPPGGVLFAADLNRLDHDGAPASRDANTLLGHMVHDSWLKGLPAVNRPRLSDNQSFSMARRERA